MGKANGRPTSRRAADQREGVVVLEGSGSGDNTGVGAWGCLASPAGPRGGSETQAAYLGHGAVDGLSLVLCYPPSRISFLLASLTYPIAAAATFAAFVSSVEMRTSLSFKSPGPSPKRRRGRLAVSQYYRTVLDTHSRTIQLDQAEKARAWSSSTILPHRGYAHSMGTYFFVSSCTLSILHFLCI
ncbi:hypothetical protein C8F01DRAFT_1266352 [Mycena amicta]|nr:hypothetical protein C8F01DRAFT_1266352 [Mycena amicta]